MKVRPSEIMAHQWAEYRRKVISSSASPDQLEQLKDAFYAGAYITLETIGNLADEPDSETDAGIMRLEGYRREIIAYLRSRSAQDARRHP